MTRISPNDQVLPSEWLVNAEKETQFQARTMIDVYRADIGQLVQIISDFADMNEEQAGQESDKADKIAASLDWEIWREKYFEFFRS